MKWPARAAALCNMLKTKAPIVQAPMAGVSNPRFAAAACQAGILGSHGVAYKTQAQLEEELDELQRLLPAGGYYAVNVFVREPPTVPADSELAGPRDSLRTFHKELGLSGDAALVPTWRDYRQHIDLLIENKVPVVSTTFGALSEAEVARLHANGSLVMGTATCVEEAVHLENTGVDVIVTQGAAAGGHRGSFVKEGGDPSCMIETLDLVRQVVGSVKVPVVAAGGIMDGKGVAEAVAAGAAGVSLGTAFVGCDESSAVPDYKKALTDGRGADTCITKAYSGRAARAISNRFTAAMEGQPKAPFPIQHALTKDIRVSAPAHDTTLAMYLIGEGAPKSRGGSVASVTAAILKEAEAAMQ